MARKQIFGTREQLARVLNVDARSAAVQQRPADGFLQQAGGKTVPVFIIGAAGTPEQEADFAELQKLTGLDRTTRARKLEAKYGKNWTMFIAGADADRQVAAAKVAKKVAPKATAALNYANLVAPPETNLVSNKPNALV